MNLVNALRVARSRLGRVAASAQPVAREISTPRFDIQAKANPRWASSQRGSRVTVERVQLFDPTSKVFAIGSCFALEIRAALRARGYEVFPKYKDVSFDPRSQKFAKMPERDSINHYDTFTIRQEFEQAFAGTHYGEKDFIVHKHKLQNSFEVGGRETWRDPYRRQILAATKEGLLDLSGQIDDRMREGILEADVYVITLGLIETWRNKANGLHICPLPDVGRDPALADIEFHLSDYAENYENLKRICSLVRSRFPSKPIVLSVSPVGLQRTFTGRDIVVANLESKSILRTAAGQICREFEHVHYWPSYEFCMRGDPFKDDGRHVTEEAVAAIVDAFISAHGAE